MKSQLVYFHRRNHLYSFLTLLFLFLSGCGGGGSDGGDPGNNSNGNNAPEEQVNELVVDCSISINNLVADLESNLPDSIPSWDQLDCYTNEAARRTIPDYIIMSADAPPSSEFDPSSGEEIESSLVRIQSWLDVATEFHSNTYNFPSNEVPPFLLSSTDTLDDQEWEQKLRAIAAFSLYIKSQGFLLHLAYFTPPSAEVTGITSPETFLAWWEDEYIPRRVELAEVAERIGAEFYQPWDVEPGQQIRSVGDGWLDQLTEEEQVSVTQQAIDLLYDAVRESFTGRLVTLNYDRYAIAGDYWKNLDLSAWDQVNFVLFTEGDVEATSMYLDEQLSGYTEMINRDNIQNWILQEVSIIENNHQRLLPMDVTFDSIEADIYNTLFSAIDDLAIQPQGMGITVGYIKTEAAVNVVHDYLGAKE